MAAPKKKTAGRTTGKKRSSAKSGSKKKKETMESFIPKEILVLTVFAVLVLLFLSNLHLCGSAGRASDPLFWESSEPSDICSRSICSSLHCS